MKGITSAARARIPVAVFTLLCAVLAGAACGDDASSGAAGDGCTTDVECKGDRICVDRQCVDPASGDGRADAGGAGTNGSGAGGSSGSRDAGTAPRAGTGAGGDGVIDDPELERACSLNCEARHAAGCEMNIGSLDQCLGQCLIADEVNHGYCLDEQRAQYACLASGGYSCISGYPQQKATCAEESLALSKCHQSAPCRTFCTRADGECAPDGEDACVSACLEQQASFEDAICGVYYTQLLGCWNTQGSCENGRPLVAPCDAAAAEVADCIGRRNHACDGFCWVAEALGCGGTECLASCMAAAEDTSCGHYYRSLVECTYESRALHLGCEDGEPTPDPVQCASALEQYTTCMSGT